MVKIFLKPSLNKAKSPSSKAYNESTLFPVVNLEKLLPDLEKTHYYKKIQEITLLPDEFFHAIYKSLIEKFALFVQFLPESYGEELGGLLNNGLRRALLAIHFLDEANDTKPHPLYMFAIFSIALLADLGKIIQYRVMISDQEGAFLDEWYPYLGVMNEFGDFFKLRAYEGTPQSLVNNVTPLLARQLLSETAITWLSSNDQIFDMWLAFLHKGDDWAQGLCKILKIDPIQFDSKVDEFLAFPMDICALESTGTELGEQFFEWLKQGLEEGLISFNEADSKVHLIQTTDLNLSVFLQAPELFQQFCNVYVKMKDWVVVCQQFNALGLTELSGTDYKIKQFFSENPEIKSGKLGFLGKESVNRSARLNVANSIKEGIVIKDAKWLFGAKIPPASQFLRDIEMRWKMDAQLPKIHQEGKVHIMQNQRFTSPK